MTELRDLGFDVQVFGCALLIAFLPASQREALVARFFEDRDYPDIADELECSEVTVRQRVSRGLAALRTRIEGPA